LLIALLNSKTEETFSNKSSQNQPLLHTQNFATKDSTIDTDDMADAPNPVAGGSGIGRNNVVQNQNVIIDPATQNVAAQLAQQILAKTNVTLKQEIVKIPDFWGEKGKDTVTAAQFINRIDKCQVSNDWNDTTTFANFSLCLSDEADEWFSSTCQLLELPAPQKTWTHLRPLFKWEFAALSDYKLIVDGQANLAHRTGQNPRKFMSRLEKLFNVLHENYASYRVKPEQPTQLPAGNYNDNTLTKFANDSVKAYNKFLLAQVFRAAAPENVCKLLTHKEQTRLTVDDACQMFFTMRRAEANKKQNMINIVNSTNNDNQDNSAPDQDVTASGHNSSRDPSNVISSKDPIFEAINPRGNPTTNPSRKANGQLNTKIPSNKVPTHPETVNSVATAKF
jgi:hypothetical protein